MDVKGPAFRVSPAISSSGALSLEDGGKPRRAGQGGDAARGDAGMQPGEMPGGSWPCGPRAFPSS